MVGQGRLAATVMRSLLEFPQLVQNEKIIRHPPKGLVIRASTDCYAVGNPLVANALHWIHNNFAKGIQATDVARAMKVSQQGLQKAFAAHFSRSPGQEIRHQRVQMANQLLSTSHTKVQAIAKDCGYYSVDTFIKSFRQVHGTTPGKYRQREKRSRSISRTP